MFACGLLAAVYKRFYLAEPQITAFSFALWVYDEPADTSLCRAQWLCHLPLPQFCFWASFVFPMEPVLIPLKIITFVSWSFSNVCFCKEGKWHLCMCPSACCSCTTCLYDSITVVRMFPPQTLSPSWRSICCLDRIFQFAKYYNSLSFQGSMLWLHCNDSKMQTVSDALE